MVVVNQNLRQMPDALQIRFLVTFPLLQHPLNYTGIPSRFRRRSEDVGSGILCSIYQAYSHVVQSVLIFVVEDFV